MVDINNVILDWVTDSEKRERTSEEVVFSDLQFVVENPDEVMDLDLDFVWFLAQKITGYSNIRELVDISLL